jgi:hypothetical protein
MNQIPKKIKPDSVKKMLTIHRLETGRMKNIIFHS